MWQLARHDHASLAAKSEICYCSQRVQKNTILELALKTIYGTGFGASVRNGTLSGPCGVVILALSGAGFVRPPSAHMIFVGLKDRNGEAKSPRAKSAGKLCLMFGLQLFGPTFARTTATVDDKNPA